MVKFGGIELDPIELGINGNAILGIKESGKSYLGTELGEMFFESGIPFIAFDPIGIWHNMRTPGKGRGYPVVVAGGRYPDIPLTVASAPEIVQAAMREQISLVIDLFSVELSKADWHRIVRSCAELLLHRNSDFGLRHVFIEEAAEFVPQKIYDGHTYAAVEKLIRMGGNSRLGCTLISPRSQEINKAVLELCENLFLFRQRGKNALENIRKWMDIAGASGVEVMKTLPSMPTGECWAWLGGSDLTPTRDQLLDGVRVALSPREWDILALVLEDPSPVERQSIANYFETHIKTKSFVNALGRLRTLGLIYYSGQNVGAADYLRRNA